MTRAHPPADARRRLRAMATWKRAAKLFTDFQVEQSDPDRFYGTMASDSVAQMQCLANLEGAHVLDVGGDRGTGPTHLKQPGPVHTAGCRCRRTRPARQGAVAGHSHG